MNAEFHGYRLLFRCDALQRKTRRSNWRAGGKFCSERRGDTHDRRYRLRPVLSRRAARRVLHPAELVVAVLTDTKEKRQGVTPTIFHSDIGTEYESGRCAAWLLRLPSRSLKAQAHPWENGRQESYYGRFKEELGSLSSHATLEDAIASVHHHILYYITRRIYSALKMPPRSFYEAWRVSIKLLPAEKSHQNQLSTPVDKTPWGGHHLLRLHRPCKCVCHRQGIRPVSPVRGRMRGRHQGPRSMRASTSRLAVTPFFCTYSHWASCSACSRVRSLNC